MNVARVLPRQIEAPILRHEKVGPGHYRIALEAPYVAEHARPGQFVQLLYRDSYGPGMRRPFSVLQTQPDCGSFEVLYLTRGSFTHGMAHLPVGHTISVVGPLGAAFQPVTSGASRLVLVAGGVGAPPIYFLAKELAGAGLKDSLLVINGARTNNLLIAQSDFLSLGVTVRVTTDDGSVGRRGTVVDELTANVAEDEESAVYACGPMPMLQAVAQFCIRHRITCQVSVETLMPCGVGVCMGCAVKVRDPSADAGYSYARACHEGPVFRAEDLLWD